MPQAFQAISRQNYDVPVAVDLQKYNAVVIYCERYNAVFGVAREESL